jgi:hypothetical protein
VTKKVKVTKKDGRGVGNEKLDVAEKKGKGVKVTEDL